MRVGITGRGGCAAEKFRIAVEAAPAAMILTGPGGRVEFANAETERMFGYRVDELVGKSVDILVPACARRRHASLRRTFLANPSKRPMGTGRDLKAVRRDGTEFPVEIGLTPLDADDGFLILATVVDISARHDVEEALSHRAMELEKTNERLARFAYIASHDLQEPLRKLVAFSEFLEEAIAAADRSEIGYANEVLRASALRARKLVDDLVTYSAITSDAQKLQGLNLRDQIKLALEACAKAIAATKAEIKVEVPRLKITADRTQFIRLVDNLLANALKFCKPNYPPKITIHAAHGHDGAVQLSIADNGIGIDPEYHATIFEPLKRLHPKGKHPGSGVGLAICKSIADRHGWEITVKSRPGDGATFLITIPPA